ncbi:MAG: polysaccharide biosynthesis/export family protein [Verrucomicrobiae bacterium]|nr:polysaccharide biosynthesis/export family protein [Verrucomicrobiae bacterium]
MHRFTALLGIVAVLALGAGCFSTSTKGPAPTRRNPDLLKPGGTGVDSEAAIRQGDSISIRITGIVPEINQVEEVNEFGTVTLPYIKEIKAEGLTPGVLAKKIERAYIDGGYYTKLSVSVIPGPRDLYVRGEVRNPGRVPWTPGLTVVKVISLAGGFGDYADKTRVEIRRRDTIININYKEAEKDPLQDVEVYPRDDVKVGRTLF